MNLDTKTIILIDFFFAIALFVFLILFKNQKKKHFKSINNLLVGLGFIMLGALLSFFKESIHEIFSIIIANLAFILGFNETLRGINYFFKKKVSYIYNYIVVVIFVIALVYFSFVENNLAARVIIFSLATLYYILQISYVLFAAKKNCPTKPSLFPAVISSLVLPLSIARIIIATNADGDKIKDGILLAIGTVLSVTFVFSILRLITDKLFQECKEQENKFKVIFYSYPNPMIMTAFNDGEILDINNKYLDLFKFTREELIGKNTLESEIWKDPNERDNYIKKLTNNEYFNYPEFKFLTKDDDEIVGLLTSIIVEVNGEKVILSSISDVTELSKMKENYRRLALHDILTNLPNRMYFNERFNELKKINDEMAILLLDIDYFKSINDEHGHVVGDKVLANISAKLQDNMRSTDIIARYGGDEFIALMAHTEGREQISSIVKRLIEKFKEPLIIDNNTFDLTASAGISIFPDDGIEVDTLIKKADIALYRVKNKAKNGFEFYYDEK
ncbi:MAG: sensor domain-containing diguanylate cyclase [Bacilli bacterium]|nr:sensor domain-containing diguanylate cyclase [Bacilli bacterium]